MTTSSTRIRVSAIHFARRGGDGPEDRGTTRARPVAVSPTTSEYPGAVDGTGEDVDGAVRPEQVGRGGATTGSEEVTSPTPSM